MKTFFNKVLVVILLVALVGAGTILLLMNFEPVMASDLIPTCSAGNVQGTLTGSVVVEDDLVALSATPVISELNILGFSQKYLSFFGTTYDGTVALVQNGEVIGQASFDGSISNFDVLGRIGSNEIPWKITFIAQDNNCDKKLDPFSADLVAAFRPENKPESQEVKHLQFTADGKTVVS